MNIPELTAPPWMKRVAEICEKNGIPTSSDIIRNHLLCDLREDVAALVIYVRPTTNGHQLCINVDRNGYQANWMNIRLSKDGAIFDEPLFARKLVKLYDLSRVIAEKQREIRREQIRRRAVVDKALKHIKDTLAEHEGIEYIGPTHGANGFNFKVTKDGDAVTLSVTS